MQHYFIRYRRKDNPFYDLNAGIDAKDIQTAKRKLERKENAKIEILEIKVIGYY